MSESNIPESSERPTVLLIEDNLDDEQLALRALRSGTVPVIVVVARDGQQGLEMLGLDSQVDATLSTPPDLIISDLKMPRLSGDEVLRQVKTDDRLNRIPFIVFSSSDDETDVRRCHELGATAYRVKPVDFLKYGQSVCDIVKTWLPKL